MKAAEKTIQRLSDSQIYEPNTKYRVDNKRWRVNLNTVKDYLDYMKNESLENE